MSNTTALSHSANGYFLQWSYFSTYDRKALTWFITIRGYGIWTFRLAFLQSTYLQLSIVISIHELITHAICNVFGRSKKHFGTPTLFLLAKLLLVKPCFIHPQIVSFLKYFLICQKKIGHHRWHSAIVILHHFLHVQQWYHYNDPSVVAK